MALVSAFDAFERQRSMMSESRVGVCHEKGVALAIAIAMTMPVSARSDEIPTLDVRPVCHGIASQSGESLESGLRENSKRARRS